VYNSAKRGLEVPSIAPSLLLCRCTHKFVLSPRLHSATRSYTRVDCLVEHRANLAYQRERPSTGDTLSIVEAWYPEALEGLRARRGTYYPVKRNAKTLARCNRAYHRTAPVGVDTAGSKRAVSRGSGKYRREAALGRASAASRHGEHSCLLPSRWSEAIKQTTRSSGTRRPLAQYNSSDERERASVPTTRSSKLNRHNIIRAYQRTGAVALDTAGSKRRLWHKANERTNGSEPIHRTIAMKRHVSLLPLRWSEPINLTIRSSGTLAFELYCKRWLVGPT
jgi:hypothetical protein